MKMLVYLKSTALVQVRLHTVKGLTETGCWFYDDAILSLTVCFASFLFLALNSI